MQNPVRYYITQSDDHAVVRSVPVSPRRAAPIESAPITPTAETQKVSVADHRRARVARLVRAASRRAELLS